MPPVQWWKTTVLSLAWTRWRGARRAGIGAITVAPETWPPLDWILRFEKALDCKGTRLRSFARFGLRSHIKHCIWRTENYTVLIFKISPLIWTASKCIERAGDSKEESPISSLVGSDYGAILNTAFEEPKLAPFRFYKTARAVSKTAKARMVNVSASQMQCPMLHCSLSRPKGR